MLVSASFLFEECVTIRTKEASKNKGQNSTFPDNHRKLVGTKIITNIFPHFGVFHLTTIFKDLMVTEIPLCLCAVSVSEITDHKLRPLCRQRTDYYLNSQTGFRAKAQCLPPTALQELWSSFTLNPHPLYISQASQPSSLTQALFPPLPAAHLSCSLCLPPFAPGWFQDGQQG